MMTIACVGAFTALFAATIALRQFDLKKVFAYSTVSQLGFMFVGVGGAGAGRGRVPSGHARVLQSAAVPQQRRGDARDGGRAGHAEDVSGLKRVLPKTRHG